MSLLLGILGISTTTALIIAAVVIGGGLFTWIAWAEFVKKHWKGISLIGSLVLVGLVSYHVGAYRAEARCEAAELRLKIEQLERDIRVQKEADVVEAAEMKLLEKQKADAEAEVAAYEKLLREHPHEGDDCTINQEDIDRLINHGKGKKP